MDQPADCDEPQDSQTSLSSQGRPRAEPVQPIPDDPGADTVTNLDRPPRQIQAARLETAGEKSGETEVTVLTSPTSASLTAAHLEAFPDGLTTQELTLALRGEMLDHFHLQEFLGGGGMGIVFRARDTTLDRDVAVKVVASHRVRTEDLQRRYLIEAQSTARLDHPNIAAVHFIGHARGLPYIVFEYIEGVNLRQLVLQQGALLTAEALSYTYQIAHALAHAWQRDVVHRDIKPSNILITPEGQAKLVDMGLARLLQVDGSSSEELTETGVTLGTFDYISPEQARDPRSADTRSDIYSLGCTLFFMLVGRPPFAEGNMMQKLLQHQDDKPPELGQFRDDIPDGVNSMLLRMLAKSPADRFQDPHELVAELTSILGEEGIDLPHSLGPLALVAGRRRVSRWRQVAPWAIPLLILLGISLWIGYADQQVTEPNFEFPTLQESIIPVE